MREFAGENGACVTSAGRARTIGRHLNLLLGVAIDPSDDKFLECAEAARADYLVTGNLRDFPRFWKGTKVITMRELMEIVAPHFRGGSLLAKHCGAEVPELHKHGYEPCVLTIVQKHCQVVQGGL